MLNGDGNENEINRSNQQKKLHVQYAFFFLIRKKFARVARFFVFLCPCFTRLQCCFVRLKRQSSQLHIIFIDELSHVLTKDFVSGVHVRFYFSLPLIFTSLATPCYGVFIFFFPRNSSRLSSVTRSCSFSVIHVSANIKNNVKKTRLCCCFFSLKVRTTMRFPSK